MTDLGRLALLTEPYLLVTENRTLAVIWCTEFAGDDHFLAVGPPEQLIDVTSPLQSKTGVTCYPATSSFVTDVAEDIESHTRRTDLLPTDAERIRSRAVWRHSVQVPSDVAASYRAVSLDAGTPVASGTYPLWQPPPAGEAVSLLLTSDHQVAPLAAVGMAAARALGPFDAIVMAGDLVKMPNRGSDWFDHGDDSAFFQIMQGRAAAELVGQAWSGGAFLQVTPMLPVPGNHEFSGRPRPRALIGETFNETQPLALVLPDGGEGVPAPTREDQANGTAVYRQLFAEAGGDEGWYAVSIGNTRVVCLCAATIWRPHTSDERPERHGESEERAADPDRWGYGQHILGFGLESSSPQHRWLLQELAGEEFAAAEVRIVVLHHPIRHLAESLRGERDDGDQDDEALPFANPVVERVDDPDGGGLRIDYHHTGHDQLLEELEPLLGQAGVDLIVNGHSHIWNRFYSPWGPVILETSNAAGTRAPDRAETRPLSTTEPARRPRRKPLVDQTGLEAGFPTVEPLIDADGHSVPYLASETFTEFSVVDTGVRVVRSYYADPATGARPILFDSVPLRAAAPASASGGASRSASSPATGDDDAPRYIDGERRMRHGYTNATSTDGRRVTKRYVGPDTEARQAAEVAALTSLAGLLPVPPVFEQGDQMIAVGFMAGTPGQDLLDELPEAVLHTVGRTARRLHDISSAALAQWLADPIGSTVPVHGDLGPQNMLFDPVTAEVTAVLDWELAHLGDPVEDLAWPEWIIRFHHADLVWALPALFDGYGTRPRWELRQATMLAKCRWALDFVHRWRLEDDAGITMWQQRIEITARFRE